MAGTSEASKKKIFEDFKIEMKEKGIFEHEDRRIAVADTKIVGTGGSATVYKLREGSVMVAEKHFYNLDRNQKNIMEEIRRLARIRKKMDERNVDYFVRLEGYITKDSYFTFDSTSIVVGLRMEYIGKSLHHYLFKSTKRKITVKKVLTWTRQLFNGIHFLHSEVGLTHRDITCDNLLITKDPKDLGKLKITDVGIAGKSRQSSSRSIRASDFYCPPETRVEDEEYTVSRSQDGYSAAVCLVLMFKRKKPDVTTMQQDEIHELHLEYLEDASHMHEELKKLARSLLDKEPKNRCPLPKISACVDRILKSIEGEISKTEIELVDNEAVQQAPKRKSSLKSASPQHCPVDDTEHQAAKRRPTN